MYCSVAGACGSRYHRVVQYIDGDDCCSYGIGIAAECRAEVSQARASENEKALSRTVTVLRRWSWLAGLFGAVVMLSTAPLLSRFTFGDDEHIWGYVWLSCALLFNALASGDQAILQGTQRLRQLSKPWRCR